MLRSVLASAVALCTLPIATMAQEANQPPQMAREMFQDWVVQCIDGPDGAQVCEMTQQLTDRESGKRAIAMGIARPDAAEGSGVLTIVTPLGLNLAEGVAVQVDDLDPLALPYSTCLPQGCIVRADLSTAAAEAMAAAETLTISMTAPDMTVLDAKLSPAGFAEAWEHLGK